MDTETWIKLIKIDHETFDIWCKAIYAEGIDFIIKEEKTMKRVRRVINYIEGHSSSMPIIPVTPFL